MKFLLNLTATHAALGRFLDHFRSLLLLGTRFYVGWQFWKSGWLKVSSWGSTLDLFRTEYHVPVLPPEIAAVTGASGEIFFPALLFLGLFGRVGALGASFMLLVLIVFGPGRIAVDSWLERRNAARCRPLSPAVPA
jgi:uncharacterized membrane protein YphA (DoxX/SURF4 family)